MAKTPSTHSSRNSPRGTPPEPELFDWAKSPRQPATPVPPVTQASAERPGAMRESEPSPTPAPRIEPGLLSPAPAAAAPTRQVRIEISRATPASSPCALGPLLPAPCPLPSAPLPARMLNEFVYCPRLFYYEYVEGVFVENADTLRGEAIHARVDRGSGALPAAAGAGGQKSEVGGQKSDAGEPDQAEIIHSRSVSLGSERLGVTAKMDLVEVQAAPVAPGETGEGCVARAVCPVDYKAGAPREGVEVNELWDTDKMQLGLQVLILRDNGYTCQEGVIYYRATKQRVRLAVTPELEAWVIAKIAEARQTAAGAIPPPLPHSPKCPRCSLVTVCLPDETRLLAEPPPAREGKISDLRFEISDGQERGRGEEAKERGIADGRWQMAEGEGSEAGEGQISNFKSQISNPEAEPPSALCPSPSAPCPASDDLPTINDQRSTIHPEVRRLIAARDDTRALYLNTPGLRVGRKDEVLQVKEEKTLLDEVRLSDVTHVALFGNIQISTQAIQAMCEAEVPVTYFSMGGWFYGITRGHELKNVFLRIEQFRLARDPACCLRLARQFVQGKIRNHRTLLMRNHLEAPAATLLRLKQCQEAAGRAVSLEELLGHEGAAAAAYFEQFAGMIKTRDDLDDPPAPAKPGDRPPRETFTFNFTHRNRRPPTDPVNALLSLAYSLLAKDCALAALAVGFDPYVGFFHQPRFGRPALALDLMEEFRPLIAESTVLSCLNNRAITPADFVRAGQAVNLTAPGRKRFFQMYEQRMNTLLTHPVFDYKVSYRRALELQARLLAKTLTGEIPDYVALVTR